LNIKKQQSDLNLTAVLLLLFAELRSSQCMLLNFDIPILYIQQHIIFLLS